MKNKIMAILRESQQPLSGEEIGRQLQVSRVAGLAVDVDEDGGLILEMADGMRRTVFYGDCFHS
ncbi:MAG: hypothetical protein VR65_12280 [Desulfobulbaceae bacterium BRH_c16a]|nr:MAG: hypothetical protein VR65_12280 [Desulfobulbaceae bacterium BRH_c16a]